MKISQISVFVENKPGRLAEITGLLGDADISMRAFSMADTTDFGIMRMIVNDPEKAQKILSDAGLTVTKTPVIAVRMGDRPGQLHLTLKLLADNGIDVEYAYAFPTKKEDDAFVVIRAKEIDAADKVFEAANIPMMKPEELYKL